MTTKEAKQIPLIDLLGSIGHLPKYTRKNGNEYWYNSPFRRETEPSFKVSVDINSWYDFGGSVGGSVVDFVMAYNNCTTSKAFEIMRTSKFIPLRIGLDEIPTFNESKAVELRSVKQLGNNPALSGFLSSRGIDIDFASNYLKEVYYRRNGKNFFTVGMRNDSNGYEVRTQHFKGCILNKNITTITSRHSVVSVFEGFMDFVSLLTLQKIGALKSDVIILHSTSCSNRAIDKILKKEYQKVFAFLDNDEAGNKALTMLTDSLNIEIKDMRYLYEGYNDINDKLLLRKL